MKEYVSIHKSEEFKNVTVHFYNEKKKPLQIGKKMYQLNDEAYMNGYNWAALLDYYLKKHHPQLLDGLEPDPEGGSYFAHYELNDKNEVKAEQFVNIIVDLIENEEKLYSIIKNEAQNIEWD